MDHLDWKRSPGHADVECLRHAESVADIASTGFPRACEHVSQSGGVVAAAAAAGRLGLIAVARGDLLDFIQGVDVEVGPTADGELVVPVVGAAEGAHLGDSRAAKYRVVRVCNSPSSCVLVSVIEVRERGIREQ